VVNILAPNNNNQNQNSNNYQENAQQISNENFAEFENSNIGGNPQNVDFTEINHPVVTQMQKLLNDNSKKDNIAKNSNEKVPNNLNDQ